MNNSVDKWDGVRIQGAGIWEIGEKAASDICRALPVFSGKPWVRVAGELKNKNLYVYFFSV